MDTEEVKELKSKLHCTLVRMAEQQKQIIGMQDELHKQRCRYDRDLEAYYYLQNRLGDYIDSLDNQEIAAKLDEIMNTAPVYTWKKKEKEDRLDR